MSSPGVQSTVPDDQAPVLVGRERERGLLSSRLAGALAGRGGLVLLGGEAGIGKTALAETLAREAAERGALVLVGRCYDLSETPPYGPWAEAFEHFPPDDRSRLPAPLGSGDAVASQAALFARVREALAATAARLPLVLLLDDLHWADPASLDLLRALARQLAALPLLLLVTYRSDELTRRHPLYALLPALVREARADRLGLRRLDAVTTRALVRARYALPDAEEGRLAAYLHDRAEGNPFYLGELLRTLQEEGLLRQLPAGLGDGWALGNVAGARVPTLLRQVIDARVARLGEQGRGLLAIAAVIGQEVPLDLWARVAEAREEALLDAVEGALEACLVEAPDEGASIRFAHALIREALYEGLLPMRRRVWHRRVGEALAALPSPEPNAVAYQFLRAGDARAAAWLVRAGERAQRAYAWLTAAERYEAALPLLEEHGGDAGERGWLLYRLARTRGLVDARWGLAALDEAARLAVTAGDRALAAVALVESGGLQVILGDMRQGFATTEAGVAAIDALAPAERARLNRLATLGAEGSDLNPYWGTLIALRGFAGPFPEVRALAERFVAQALVPSAAQGRSLAFAGQFSGTYLALGIAHAMLGQPAEARRAFAEARAVGRPVGDHLQLGEVATQELVLVALAYQPERIAERRRLADELVEEFGRASSMGMTTPRLLCLPLLVLEGRWAEALALALEGSTSASYSAGRLVAMLWLGWLAREQGESDLAWAQARAALPADPAAATSYGAPWSPRLAHELALDARDLPTARAWLEAYDRWLAQSGAVLGQADRRLAWAAYHRAAGDLALAHQHAAQALAQAGEPRQPLALLAAHRLLGELNTAVGRHAEAAEHLDQALVLAEDCAAPYERALTLLALAEQRAATGNASEAQALLDEARAICTPLGAKRILAQAEALGARLASAASRPSLAPANPASLTAREVEVLRLVAQGLSDAQIAERLYLSVHTIKTHLRAIYAKLDVPSRTAAARVAAEHGLI